METTVKKVTSKAANGYFGIIAQDNTGGMIHFCCKNNAMPKAGDKLHVFYLRGHLSSVEFNGQRIR